MKILFFTSNLDIWLHSFTGALVAEADEPAKLMSL